MTEMSYDDKVAKGRSEIDTIDGDIIRLIRERQGASAAVQQARVDAGEPRLHNAREITILKRYGGGLGKPGTTLAMAVLNSCRGRQSMMG